MTKIEKARDVIFQRLLVAQGPMSRKVVKSIMEDIDALVQAHLVCEGECGLYKVAKHHGKVRRVLMLQRSKFDGRPYPEEDQFRGFFWFCEAWTDWMHEDMGYDFVEMPFSPEYERKYERDWIIKRRQREKAEHPDFVIHDPDCPMGVNSSFVCTCGVEENKTHQPDCAVAVNGRHECSCKDQPVIAHWSASTWGHHECSCGCFAFTNEGGDGESLELCRKEDTDA